MTHTATLQTPRVQSAHEDGDVELPITVRHADGRIEQTTMSPRAHRETHLRMLHDRARCVVEIAAGRRDEDGELHIYTRKRSDHFLPGGGMGDPEWLERLMRLVTSHHEQGHDVFVGPAIHARASANKEAITFSEWAWVDIDGPDHLGRLDALLLSKPARARIVSGGSGGEHVYWPLCEAMPARTLTIARGHTIVNPAEVTERTKQGGVRVLGYRDTSTGELISGVRAEHWIEKANLRLIHKLGRTSRDGQQVYVADIKCRNRSRLMRLAGTVHGETGEYARISYLDLALPAYSPKVLFGDLADPSQKRPRRRPGLHRFAPDPLMQIPADVYFWRLAGIELPARGNISCPNPAHPDVHPSCSVSDYVFYCHADVCGVQGTVIDLWSLLNGGPTGDELAASPAEFKRAKRGAQEAMGLT
jgi:hypothetical protein